MNGGMKLSLLNLRMKVPALRLYTFIYSQLGCFFLKNKENPLSLWT